jgi:hypothetical protein
MLWVHLKGNVFVLALAHASMNAPVFFLEQALPSAPGQLLAGWRYLSIVYLSVAVIGGVCLHRRWTEVGITPATV